MELFTLELFAGAGGAILAGELLGHRCVGAVEIEPYARKVLLARQLDGSLPIFPVWDDVRTFRRDNPECKPFIDWLVSNRHRLVISGGFPCTDLSVAGKKAGITGKHSGLWSEYARIIGEVRPRYVFAENSPNLLNLGFERVVQDLAAMGYRVEYGCLSASAVGARHKRDRIWILAYAHSGASAAEIAGKLAAESQGARRFGPADRATGDAGGTGGD